MAQAGGMHHCSLARVALPIAGYGYNIGDQRLMTDFDELGAGGAAAWGPADDGLMNGAYEGYNDASKYDADEMRKGYIGTAR